MDYAFLESLPVGVVLIDYDTDVIIYSNKNVRKTLCIQEGAGPELGLWSDFVCEKTKETVLAAIDAQQRKGNEFQIECEVTRRDGAAIWVLANGRHFVSEEGRMLVSVTVTDTTEVKQLQRNLENINESIPGGLVITQADQFFTIIYANSAFYSLLGYSRREMQRLYNNQAAYTILMEDLPMVADCLLNRSGSGERFNLEARLVKKGGDIIWVRMEGLFIGGSAEANEMDRLYCVLVDISKHKEIVRNLEQERRLNQLIQNLSDDVLFNLDIVDRVMTFSENTLKSFDVDSVMRNFPESILKRNVVCDGDMPTFLNVVLAMYDGLKYTAEFRLINRSGHLSWHRLEYDFLVDDFGRAVKTVGKMVNIDSHKSLERQATQDPLTKLCNKMETQERISRIFEASKPGDTHAFYIVDVDNFKGVNDTLGHHFGDMVLTDIAANLQRLFNKPGTVLGRIGGDEFVVLFCNISSKKEAMEKAAAVSDAFRHTFSGESKEYKVSGSVGVAMFPAHGKTYDDLYTKADLGLYASKHKGKDCATLYTSALSMTVEKDKNALENLPGEESNDDAFGAMPLEAARRYEEENFREDILYNVFDLLYETQDIYISVNKALEIVGKNFGISRCYILEYNADSEEYNNTYEWCAEGITSRMTRRQSLQAAEMKYATSRFNPRGMFCCCMALNPEEILQRTLKMQGVEAMLLCSMRVENGRSVGIIGFEDCRDKGRVWTGKDVAVLTYVTKILSVYLANNDISKAFWELHRNNTEMLSNMHGNVYVIDYETYELQFYNKSFKRLVKGVKCGDKCYEALSGRQEPCKGCPIFRLEDSFENVAAEVYSEKFDTWSLTTASKIRWVGCSSAALICCTDITRLKN